VDHNTAGKPDPNRPSVKIPDHELLRLIGRGAYGEVWLARSVMGTYRAVKVVYRSSFEDDRPFQRELSGIRKYEPISRSHEKFIDILQIGINEEQGYFYYVMELGDDVDTGQTIHPDSYVPKTLTRALKSRGKISFAECLDLGLSLSQALVELHKHELVHRDIKPSNIIFVNGVAKLADIGLIAKTSEARSIVGTEGYILSGRLGTPEGDVFSLGKVLYEASTGNDRLQFPELPTMLGPSAEQDKLLELNEVILQACQSDGTQRYASAWEMYSDLLVLADGKSVKRLRFLERRFAQFKKIAAVGAVVAGVGAAIFYTYYRERQNARAARQRQIGANVERGLQAIDSWDVSAALPSFANAIALDALDNGDGKREAIHRFMFANALARCPKLVKVLSRTNDVSRVQFSPNGGEILICDGRARIFNAAPNALPSPKAELGTNVFNATYSPDGKCVATAEGTNVNIWRLDDLSVVATLPHESRVFSLCFSPDRSHIATGSSNGIVRIWDATKWTLVSTQAWADSAITGLAFNSESSKIASTSLDRTARVWSVQGELRPETIPCSSGILHGDFSPDGNQLVIATSDHDAYVWSIGHTDGAYFHHRLRHGDQVREAQFSPDGRFILTASHDHTVRIWSAETYEARYPIGILRHFDRVTSASFSSDSRRIVTGSADGTVCVWDLAGSDILPELENGQYSHDGTRYISRTSGSAQVIDSKSGVLIAEIALSQDAQVSQITRNGHFLLSFTTNADGSGRTFTAWDCEQGRSISRAFSVANPPKGTNGVATNGAAISHNGRRLATFEGREARIWDLAVTNGQPRVITHSASITKVFFNRDASVVVILGDKLVRVCDAATGQDVFPPLRHQVNVLHAAFSPDESRLVTCCQTSGLDECDAQLWDARTGRPVLPPFHHGDGVLWADFSPDGKRLVTACEDHSATVWSTEDGHRICPPLLHDGSINRVMFSSDGQRIVTASEDAMARVWDAETGDPLTPPLEHFMRVKRASFLPGDNQIATVTWDEHTWVWNLPLQKHSLPDLLSLSQLLSGRPLGSTTPLPESPAAIWNRLHAADPSLFETTTNEIAAWEEYSAQDSTRHHYWRAAVSHWQRRLEFNPGDERIKAALAEAEKKLSEYLASQSR
jgi:WD40 repeat protein